MRYLALRRRADLLLAGLGADRSRTLVIEGGLGDADLAPADHSKLSDSNPAEPAPPEPPPSEPAK
jgi:hypothetical protein